MKQSKKHTKQKRRRSSRSQSSRSQSYSQQSSSQRKHKKQKHNRRKGHRKDSKKDKGQRKDKKHKYHKEKNQNTYEKNQQKYEKNQQKYEKYQSQHKIQHLEQQMATQKYYQSEYKNYERNQNILQEKVQVPKKQTPCFQPSGILLQYYNSRQGISLKFHQPAQSRIPIQQWRIYVFKGQQVLKPMVLNKSCYLVGKDQQVVDILTQNPSISRQHCVLQFRLIQKRNQQGQYQEQIKPYIMDLDSTNGTYLNDQRIQSSRYYQLFNKDVIKFGWSQREYVIVRWEGEPDQGM